MRRREFTVGLSVLTLTAACSSGDRLYIGVAAPMSGPQTVQGEYIKKGVQLAVDEVNAKGGISGKLVELVVEDDEARPDAAVAVANKLANNAAVLAVIGHFNSGCSIPASQIYSDSGLAMLTPGSTAVKLTDRGLTNILRLVGRDDQQSRILADFALGPLSAKKIAILHDNTPYGKELADYFRRDVAGRAQVLFFEGITQGDKDFRAVLTRIKTLAPDTLFFGGVFVEGGLMVRQARELGLAARFLSGDGSKDQTFIELAGSNTGDIYIAGPKVIDNQTFVEAYRSRYSEEPGPFSPYSYDAARLLLTALARTTPPSRDAVRAELKKLRDFQGLAGTITFDKRGDRTEALFDVFKIQDGKFTPYT